MATRVEKDSLGEMQVPADALYGAQTARAIANFPISGLRPHPTFVWATVEVKRAAAVVNRALGDLPPGTADAIVRACDEVLAGEHRDQFVVDVFQAGAGTSHNMNTNEVIANRAAELLGGRRGDKGLVHPNDHVNRGQSTNDVIPTAIRLCSLRQLRDLDAALARLADAFAAKGREFAGVLKSGRTHLQDAVPMRLGSELAAWARSVANSRARLDACVPQLAELGIGGNAIGSGVNTPPEFARRVSAELAAHTGLPVQSSPNLYERCQSTADFAQLSGSLRTLALELTRIVNDIRLLASGPATGIGEILLPPVQPGSSIMPGKVNPVMAEMLNMVCYHVIGADACVAMATQAGQLELNVMMPVIAHNLNTSLSYLTNAVSVFVTRCVELEWVDRGPHGEEIARHGLAADTEACAHFIERSTGLATLLNPAIGYDAAADVMKQARREKRSVREVVVDRGLMTAADFDALLERSVER
ncbi:MAG: aspartate ammonia-lyase [Chthonomonadales bacterium]|nr:aspartate ammonia-lyase [Chthonomonadales bacterium]